MSFGIPDSLTIRCPKCEGEADLMGFDDEQRDIFECYDAACGYRDLRWKFLPVRCPPLCLDVVAERSGR